MCENATSPPRCAPRPSRKGRPSDNRQWRWPRDADQSVKAWLDDHFNRLRIVETDHCQEPYPILLGVGRFDPAKAGLAASESSHGCEDPACPEVGHELGHSNVFSTESYETDLPLSLDRLREALKTLPPDVYRAKGIVNSADAPRHRVVVQIVGRRVDITIDDEWGERTPRTDCGDWRNGQLGRWIP